MASQVLTYSPSDVKIVISGYVLTGILSVEVNWRSAPFTFRPGIRGNHTRTRNNDTSAKVKIVVQSTSVTNDVLSDIVTQDRVNQSALLEFAIQDNGGTTIIGSNNCYIPGYAPLKFSQGLEVREWEIDILSLRDDYKVGGNAGAGFDLFSSVDGALDLLGNTATRASGAISGILNS